MQRIMIIGPCGAGKSTLARKLHQQLSLELIHLDQLYWQPNWTETDPGPWKKIVEQIVQKDQWIIDGNFGSTMDIRIEKADTIIFLAYSTFTCITRVLQRIWQNYGRVRPDMTEGCQERLDLDFLHYVLVFNLTKTPKILAKLEKVKSTKKVFIFNNDQEADFFLKSLV